MSDRWPSNERLRALDGLYGSVSNGSRSRSRVLDDASSHRSDSLSNLPSDVRDLIKALLPCEGYFRLKKTSRALSSTLETHRCEEAKQAAIDAFTRMSSPTNLDYKFVESLNEAFVKLLEDEEGGGGTMTLQSMGGLRFFNVLEIVGHAAPEKLYESRVFDFKGHGFDEDVMKGLCQVLCIEGLTYTNVDLRGNKLSEEDATQLSSAIVKHASLPNPTLVRFNGIHLYAIRNMNMNEDYQLGFQNVGDVGCMVLAGLLKYRWKLNPMPILLRGNGITQLGAGALMEAIASCETKAPVSLTLSDNLIAPDGEQLLVNAIGDTRSTYGHLDMRFNPIIHHPSNSLSAAIVESPQIWEFNCIPIETMRTNAHQITSFDLSNSLLGLVGCEVVARLFPEMPATPTSINLSENNLDDDCVEALAPALRDTLSLTSIDLSNNFIGGYYVAEHDLPDDNYEVGNSLRYKNKVWTVKRAKDDDGEVLIVGTIGATVLKDVILAKKNRSLASINLSLNYLCVEGATALAPAIRGSDALTSINLSDNMLGPEGAKALAPAIHDSSSMTSVGKDGLNLKHNSLGDAGWGEVFEAVCSSKASKISSVDASNEGIGPMGANLISQALKTSVNGSLTKISLAGNLLGEEGTKIICDAVTIRATIKELDLSGELVSENISGATGARHVADMLNGTASLTKISLARNNLGEEGTRLICDAVKHNTTIKELDLSGGYPLFNNIGRAAGAKHVADMLIGTPSLTSIGLRGNRLGTEGAKELAPAIGKSASLTSIDLSNNSLRATGANELLPALGASASLTDLNLTNNFIGGYFLGNHKLIRTPEGADAIADALRSSSSLTSIDLRSNTLGSESATVLAPGIRDSASITCIDARLNDISGDGAFQLSAAVLGNLKIEKFNTIPIKEMRTDTFTHLELKSKDLGLVGGMVVAGLLPDMHSLASIDLAFNDLTHHGQDMTGIDAIADALVKTSIRSVGKDGLNLKDNVLGSEGWGAIFNAVCSNADSNITSIDASFEGIGPDGANLIGQALRFSVNRSLASIDLSDNFPLDSGETASIRNAVAQHSGLAILV